MLAGNKDALALLGMSAGVFASSPWLSGSDIIYPMLAASSVGGAHITHKYAKGLFSRLNVKKRENFILKSDETFNLDKKDSFMTFGVTKDKNKTLDLLDDLLVRHTSIVGQSGVGKTTLSEYLLYQQMVRGGGWAFIDGKVDGDSLDHVKYMAAACGRLDDLYVLNINDPENSHTYNPALFGDADEIASRFMNLIPSTESSPGADHFKQGANYALTSIIGALHKEKLLYHFGDLSLLLQSGKAFSALEMMMDDSEEKRTFQIFLNQYRHSTKEGTAIDVKRLKETLGGISGRIALYAQGKFGKIFNTYKPDVILEDIILGNKFLYIPLPTMGKDTAALNVAKMLLSDLRSAVANIQSRSKKYRPNPPFVMLADEMGSYVMPGISRLFEQARSASIAMIPSFQSFSQLNMVSPDFADMVIQNTWNKVFFKFGSNDSTETAADLIGKTFRKLRSVSVNVNEGNTTQSLRTTPRASDSGSGGISKSWNEREMHRVTPDQLKALQIGEAVALIGSRMFHIDTPMLNFPDDLGDLKLIKHKGKILEGWKPCGFHERYENYILK